MEKFRHSPEGRTADVGEKLRQMVSASVRAYRDGPVTLDGRKQIVADYLDATPLAARPAYGEAIGLGDGLLAWFGADFGKVNELLATPTPVRGATGASADDFLQRQAIAYRQVLSLLIAQRRPSELLISDREVLEQRVDAYLRILSSAGIVPLDLRDAALAQRLRFREERMGDSVYPAMPGLSPSARKAALVVRARLMQMLRLPSLYDLDRLDLTVESTLDKIVQEQVTELLRSLSRRETLDRLGLAVPRLLDRGAPENVVYSFTLYEAGADRNYLRVQADNQDRPLDINDGTRLDLGSTAKLRTMVSYLEAVADAYERLRVRSPVNLGKFAAVGDPLSRWVAAQLAAGTAAPGPPALGLPALLEAAVRRPYSASPKEAFFTAGGLHRFANYDKADDGRVLPIVEAFHHSVNLPFIRLMREVSGYHAARIVEERGDPFAADSAVRADYLRRFADREGAAFMARFHERYRHLDADGILAAMARRTRPAARRLAVVYRSLRPEGDVAALAAFLDSVLPENLRGGYDVAVLHGKYARDRFSLNDRAYLAGLHPLELWLGEFLTAAPRTRLVDVLAASGEIRQEAYKWLFRPSRTKAQDQRIRTVVEEEAFARIGEGWRRLGYPFERVVPSYASAIGSSGDRPAALAELVGIIVNGGLRLPIVRFERLQFAEGTPFETVLKRDVAPVVPVLRPEVAAAAFKVLVGTVESGTGRRISGVFRLPDGSTLPVGGKTGTGDHRFEQFDRHGNTVASRVVNRTATFVFFLGDRFFGTVSAHVAGPDAADYGFTSALPTQLVKTLAPVLQPLIDRAAVEP